LTNDDLPQLDGGSSLQGIQGGGRILSVQRQLRLNRRQPKRLHLRVQREALVQGLGPAIRLAPYRPPWQTQRGFDSRRPDSREPASKPLPLLPRFRRLPKRLPQEQHSPARLPHFPCCPLGWRSPPPAWSVPAPCQMTGIRLGVGCERQPQFSKSGLPANHCCCSAIAGGVRPEKGKSVEIIVEYESSSFRACASWMICRASSKRCKASRCWRDSRTNATRSGARRTLARDLRSLSHTAPAP
jgi:hypothetical protein